MKNITWKYVKPLENQNSVSELEKNIGISLPLDIQQIFQKYNNGRPSLKLFDTSKEVECEFKKLLSLNTSDAENIYDFLKLESKFKELVPIASTPSGNLICLYDGKIVYWNHELDSIEELSNSFTNFLEKLY